MGEYIVRSYAGKGWVVNFADASARGEAKPSLLYAYGKGVDSKLMKEFSSYLLLQMKEEQRRIALTQIGTDIYRGLRAFSCLPEILKISPKFEIPSYSFIQKHSSATCIIRTVSSLHAREDITMKAITTMM